MRESRDHKSLNTRQLKYKALQLKELLGNYLLSHNMSVESDFDRMKHQKRTTFFKKSFVDGFRLYISKSTDLNDFQNSTIQLVKEKDKYHLHLNDMGNDGFKILSTLPERFVDFIYLKVDKKFNISYTDINWNKFRYISISASSSENDKLRELSDYFSQNHLLSAIFIYSKDYNFVRRELEGYLPKISTRKKIVI